MKNAVPHTNTGNINADNSICFIQIFPPIRAYKEPPKYPFTGDVAAYTNIAVDSNEPRLNRNFTFTHLFVCEFLNDYNTQKTRYLLCIQFSKDSKTNYAKNNCS